MGQVDRGWGLLNRVLGFKKSTYADLGGSQSAHSDPQ